MPSSPTDELRLLREWCNRNYLGCFKIPLNLFYIVENIFFFIQKVVLLHSFSSNFQEILLHRKQYNAVYVIEIKQMRVTYGRTEIQILKETALLE